MPWPEAAVLHGAHIRLEPLDASHAPGILDAGSDPSLWAWMARGPFVSLEDAARWIAEAAAARAAGTDLAFAVVRQADGAVLGSTRYMEIRAAHLGLEIGWTWYRRDAWGTDVNPEAKLLLLRHAFEASGAERVEFKTDGRNERSQGAIARLGAVREGVFRHHRRRPDGTWRDSVYFSILREEWPAARAALEARLRR